MKAAVLCGIGYYLPPEKVTNDDLSTELDTSNEWIQSRTGILERFKIVNGMSTSFLAYKAGKSVLESTKIESVDMLIVATSTPDRSCPATAPMVAHKLNLGNIPAFDISAVCSGFVYGLSIAQSCIESGLVNTIMVIGSDAFSTILNPKDRTTRVIFGDGAGAIILRAGEHTEPGALVDCVLGSDGSGYELITVRGSGSDSHLRDIPKEDKYFTMHGKAVFTQAISHLTEVTQTVLKKSRWNMDEVDHFIFHQANKRILTACAEELNVPEEKFYSNIAKVGNTVAASIPIALYYAQNDGVIKPRDTLVLSGFGGGLTWGAVTLSWPYL